MNFQMFSYQTSNIPQFLPETFMAKLADAFLQVLGIRLDVGDVDVIDSDGGNSNNLATAS